MKRWSAIVAVAAFAIFAVADIVHDFVTNDPVRYFAEQPRRLLLVAAIGIAGGLVALVFYRLSPRSQRSVKLFTLGSPASCLTVFAGYFLFEFPRLSPELGAPGGSLALLLVPLCLGVVILLLWLEFYQVFKRRVL